MSQASFPSAQNCGVLGCHSSDNVLIVPVPDKGRKALCADCREDIPGGDPA